MSDMADLNLIKKLKKSLEEITWFKTDKKKPYLWQNIYKKLKKKDFKTRKAMEKKRLDVDPDKKDRDADYYYRNVWK